MRKPHRLLRKPNCFLRRVLLRLSTGVRGVRSPGRALECLVLGTWA